MESKRGAFSGGAGSKDERAPSRKTGPVLVALAFLYTGQGIPFGFATEYLPVVVSALPALLLRRWGSAVSASAGDSGPGDAPRIEVAPS
jgi:hypothetical protein